MAMMVTMGVVYRLREDAKGERHEGDWIEQAKRVSFLSLGRIRVCYSPWKIMHDRALLISLDHLMIYISKHREKSARTENLKRDC